MDAIDWAKVAIWSSIIGTPLTLIGLFVAIITSIRSKSASDQAKSAVKKVREDILAFDIISDLSKTIYGLQEIKRSIRVSQLTSTIPDRFSDLRQALIAIRETITDLTDDEQIIFQDSISDLNSLESTVDNCLQNDNEKTDTPSILSSLSDITDSLQRVLAGLRNRIGREK